MIKKPTSSAARTTILPHTLQHADSIAGEMHRIALGFIVSTSTSLCQKTSGALILRTHSISTKMAFQC